MPSVFDWLRAHKRTMRRKKGIKLSPTAKIVIWLLFALVIYLILKYVGNIIYPFILAIITGYLFAPLIEYKKGLQILFNVLGYLHFPAFLT